jgi:hypothetical protein
MEYSPYAEIFPMLGEVELAELAEDIQANGLREPIVLDGDRILDGRNRLEACRLAGVEPRFDHYNGDDPLGYVISLNLHRRHLNESQRSMVAANIATMTRGDNQHAPIEATSQGEAARLLNVSRSAVQRAHQVRAKGAPTSVGFLLPRADGIKYAAKVIRSTTDEQR